MFTAAIESVFQLDVLVVIAMAAIYGIAIGAIPGLTATMAVALMVPLTFYLDDIQAIAAIVTTVTCSIFAGDLPTTLVRIPGTPSSAAYADDAYALTRSGRHMDALHLCLWCSVLGGLFGVFVLACAAPPLAQIATQFTSFEYFWLYLLGLSCSVIVSPGSRIKGFFALLIGLLLSTVGLGTDFSVPRMTFGFDQLVTGIRFIPAMIGLFGISEVLRNALSPDGLNQLDRLNQSESEQREPTSPLHQADNLGPGLGAWLWNRKLPLFRSSTIGATIGMLPGAGADIAAWISYAVSKQFSHHPKQYGRGATEGLADASGANNAALGGAWIPALVFGIPGDSVTAIAIGVLMMKNITPGPGIFDAAANPDQSTLVASIFVTFVVANLMLIPIGLGAIRVASVLIKIPRRILLPLIVLFCIIGAYSMTGSYFDVSLMLAMGLLGFMLETWKVPLGPIVLGLILGGQLEHRFLQSLTVSSGLSAFFANPISITLGGLCILLWSWPLIKRLRRKHTVA
ncbi:MAG: tripartite tricarboxylate transporter permease [Planctomycetota bacterium]|nr:tripartite tricarboxylate transporter permease [Planctomycetota bacterium]